MDPGRLQWTHFDSTGNLDDVARRAWTVAKSQAWNDSEEHQALFRAWLISILAQVANLGPSPVRETSSPEATGGGRSFAIVPQMSEDPAKSDWQRMLVYGLAALVPDFKVTTKAGKVVSWTGPAIPPGKVLQITTRDGDPPKLTDTAQIGIVEGFVVVGVALALGAAVAWIASQVSEVAATQIATDNNKAKLVASMTTSAELIENHRAAELQMGHEIPYDAQELAMLQTLRGTIADAAKWEPPALKSVPDVAGLTKAAGEAAKKVGEGAGYVLPVIVGILVLTLMNRMSPRRAAA